MTGQLQLFLIAILAVVLLIIVFYVITQKRSTQKIEPGIGAETEIAHSKETVKPVQEPLTSAQIAEEKPQAAANRRKSDYTIPKRSVPPLGKITKENFSEFAGERILVAEDNPINQKVILGLLAGCGIEIVLANDGQEALEILERDSNFLMILMDAHMPRVDGFEATRIIRSNPQYDHILVVALSGDVGADDIQKMESAGMAEQLAKPLRIESLYKIFYAYSTKQIQHHAAVNNILDSEEGVQICGGDEKFYREILAEFVNDYGDSANRLGDFLRAHDIHGADALLLDIIGVTANIGAHSLGDTASHLKHALNDAQEKSYFSLYDRYKLQLDRLLHEIRAYL